MSIGQCYIEVCHSLQIYGVYINMGIYILRIISSIEFYIYYMILVFYKGILYVTSIRDIKIEHIKVEH